ncbi:MAG: YgeY family selenium metabolism-linked hydrolase [Spirochaetota bacterium]
MKRSEEILEKAEAYREDTAQVLSELVRIKSYSAQEKDVCLRLEEMCREYGFDEVRIDGLGSVIARIGSGPKSIAFDAHIDTVEVGDPAQWEKDPFSGEVSNGYVYGRGSADQKGGAASMLTAGRILKDLDYDGEYTVYFTFTVMEEDCDGMCWKYLIEEEGFRPDFIVSTEPSSCRIHRGQRGRMEMEARIKGVSSHGSAPERGVNAGYKASRAALAMEQLNEDLRPDEDNFLGKGTIVVSQIDAHGPSQCAVPDQAMLYLDRRLTWGEDKEQAIAEVKRYMSAALGEEESSIEVTMPSYDKRGWKDTDYTQELYFPTWKIPEDHDIIQAGAKAYRTLWAKQPVIDKWTFSTNLVSATGLHEIPALGFGPGDEPQAHAPNEYTRVEDLVICSAFYAMLPYTLGGAEEGAGGT